MEGKGVSVMFDDRRDSSPGVKFKDAELIGNPYIIIVGKGLQEGKVEFRVRKSGEKSELPVSEIVAHVMKLVG